MIIICFCYKGSKNCFKSIKRLNKIHLFGISFSFRSIKNKKEVFYSNLYVLFILKLYSSVTGIAYMNHLPKDGKEPVERYTSPTPLTLCEMKPKSTSILKAFFTCFSHQVFDALSKMCTVMVCMSIAAGVFLFSGLLLVVLSIRGGPNTVQVDLNETQFDTVCRKFGRRVIFILGNLIKCNGYEARQVSLLFFVVVFVRSLNSVTVHNVEQHRFPVVFNKRAGQFLANRAAEAFFPRY